MPEMEIDKDGMLDHTPLTFGMYKGLSPEKVVDQHGSRGEKWLRWAYETVGNKPVCSAALYKDIGGKGKRATGGYGNNTPQQRTHSAAHTQSGKMAAANDLDDDIPF